jgi:UDP-glucose 4-epimerase
MRVLITGGAGYIGTALCQKLAQDKGILSVTIYDNLSRANYNAFIGIQKLDQRFRFVHGDILDSRKLRKAIREADIVFHLAAKVTTPFADQDAHLFEQVNHWGSAEVGYAVEDSEVQRLVYLSSVSVYGSGGEIKNVETALNPKTFYGISKMRGEEHIRRLSDKFQTHIIRCGNVYGYNRSMRFDAVINKFMFEANFQGKINIHGNGSQKRPFVFIDTVAAALMNTMDNQKTSGTFNLVEDNFEVNDIVEALKTVYPDLEMIYINHNMRMRELVVDAKQDEEAVIRLTQRLRTFKEQFTF